MTMYPELWKGFIWNPYTGNQGRRLRVSDRLIPVSNRNMRSVLESGRSNAGAYTPYIGLADEGYEVYFFF